MIVTKTQDHKLSTMQLHRSHILQYYMKQDVVILQDMNSDIKISVITQIYL